MASYELNTLKDVLDAIDEEKQLDPGLVSDLEKRRFVQDALDDIGDLGLMEKAITFSLTDHSGSLDLAVVDGIETGFESVVEAYWEGRALPLIAPREVNRERTSSSPAGYWVAGNKLYFYPMLDKASGELIVEMVYRPAWMVNLDDPVPLPREWRRLLVLYAVHRCHKKNGNKFSADDYLMEYETIKGRLVTKSMQARNDRPTAVRQPYDTNWLAVRGY